LKILKEHLPKPFIFTEKGIDAYLENLYASLMAFENTEVIKTFLKNGKTEKPYGNPLTRSSTLRFLEYLRQIRYFLKNDEAFSYGFARPLYNLFETISGWSNPSDINGYVFMCSPPQFHRNFNRNLSTATMILMNSGLLMNALMNPEDCSGNGWYRFESSRVFPYINRIHQKKISARKIEWPGAGEVISLSVLPEYMKLNGTPVTYEYTVKLWDEYSKRYRRYFFSIVNAKIYEETGYFFAETQNMERFSVEPFGKINSESGAFIFLKKIDMNSYSPYYSIVQLDVKTRMLEKAISSSTLPAYVSVFLEKTDSYRHSTELIIESMLDKDKNWADFVTSYLLKNEQLQNLFVGFSGINITDEEFSARILKEFMNNNKRYMWLLRKYLQLITCKNENCRFSGTAWKALAVLKQKETVPLIEKMVSENSLYAGEIASFLYMPVRVVHELLENTVKEGKIMKCRVSLSPALYCRNENSQTLQDKQDCIAKLFRCFASMFSTGISEEKLRYYLNSAALVSGSPFFTEDDFRAFKECFLKSGNLKEHEDMIIAEPVECAELTAVRYFEQKKDIWAVKDKIIAFGDMYFARDLNTRCTLVRDYVMRHCAASLEGKKVTVRDNTRESLKVSCLHFLQNIKTCITYHEVENLVNDILENYLKDGKNHSQ